MANLKFQPVRHDHKKFLESASRRCGFAKAYEALKVEYALAHEILAARERAGLNQEAVALRVGTTKSAISRLESVSNERVPSVASLKKYADAVGCTLKIQLVPVRSKSRRKRE